MTILSRSALLLLLFMLVPLNAVAADQVPETAVAEEEALPYLPAIRELIPSSTELAYDLTVLRKDLDAGYDPSTVEGILSKSRANLGKYSTEFKKLKESGEYDNFLLLQFNANMQKEVQDLSDAANPIGGAIAHLEDKKAKWLEDRANWTKWQSTYSEDDSYDNIRSTFAYAHSTIDTALNLISEQMKNLLAAQFRVGMIMTEINSLSVDVDSLIVRQPADSLVGSSPILFSSRYFRQLSRIEWDGMRENLREASRLILPFFAEQGWVVILLVILTTSVIVIIRRNKEQLQKSRHWRFVADRPFSIGLLVGLLVVGNLFVAFPPLISFILYLIAGISMARLLPQIVKESWRRHFLYGLIVFTVVDRFFRAINLPEPLIRVYFLLGVLVGFLFCMGHVSKSHRQERAFLKKWVLRLGALFFFIIFSLNVWGGKTALAGFVLESTIRSILLILGFWLLFMLSEGVMEWAVDAESVQNNLPIVKRNREFIISRSYLILRVIFGTVYLAAALVAWRVFDSTPEAVVSLLTNGFKVGEQEINLLLVVVAAAAIYVSFILSLGIQKLLEDQVFEQRNVDIGVQQSLTHLIHYALIFIGFFVAVSILGFDFTKITIIFGALSVGIGFGLQNIVNNFVCGLIMLFERPIRVGDVIEFGGIYAEVKKIGLRATWVRTFNNEEIVVPNSDLITNQVTNCTLTDRMIRRVIPVGVAYGSDVPLVMKTLMDIASESSSVLEKPEPVVLFKQFGDSTLNFELFVWIGRFEDSLSILSQLYQEIDRRFRDTGIEIAFPQMDLHLRSVDEKAGSLLGGSNPPEPETDLK